MKVGNVQCSLMSGGRVTENDHQAKLVLRNV